MSPIRSPMRWPLTWPPTFKEAEAEGISAEEFLGSSVFDPRSFAASWAAERGIIPVPPTRGSARRRPLVLVAFTAVAALAALVAALLIVTGQPTMSIVASKTRRAQLPLPLPSNIVTTGSSRVVIAASASAPIEWILLLFAIIALAFAAWLWARWGRSRSPTAVA